MTDDDPLTLEDLLTETTTTEDLVQRFSDLVDFELKPLVLALVARSKLTYSELDAALFAGFQAFAEAGSEWVSEWRQSEQRRARARGER